jgi:hypothetical protein
MGSTLHANRPFQFEKRSQLLIGTHNETLSIVAVCVSNENSLDIFDALK